MNLPSDLTNKLRTGVELLVRAENGISFHPVIICTLPRDFPWLHALVLPYWVIYLIIIHLPRDFSWLHALELTNWVIKHNIYIIINAKLDSKFGEFCMKNFRQHWHTSLANQFKPDSDSTSPTCNVSIRNGSGMLQKCAFVIQPGFVDILVLNDVINHPIWQH